MSGDPAVPVGDRSEKLPMSSDNAAAKFTFFAKLPAELRVKIWSFAARTPNTLKLKIERYPIYHRAKPRRETGKRTQSAYFTWGYQISSPSPLRGVLYACVESRLESLKSGPRYLKLQKKPTKIYFFPSIDTISMDRLSHFALAQLGTNRRLGKATDPGFDDIQSIFLPEAYGTTSGVGCLHLYLCALREVTVGFLNPFPFTALEMEHELAGALDKQLEEKYCRSRGGGPARNLQLHIGGAVQRFLTPTLPPLLLPPGFRDGVPPLCHFGLTINVITHNQKHETLAY